MDGSGKDSPGREKPISGTRPDRPSLRLSLVAHLHSALPRPSPKNSVLARLIDLRRRSVRRWPVVGRFPQLTHRFPAPRRGAFSTHPTMSSALPL